MGFIVIDARQFDPVVLLMGAYEKNYADDAGVVLHIDNRTAAMVVVARRARSACMASSAQLACAGREHSTI